MSRPTILLSEGSSTNARETVTALGLAGYRVDVCDPNHACLCRFSRFVGRVHRSPASGTDPIGHLRTVVDLVRRHGYDVVLPVNEQAYLYSWAREVLEPLTGLAVADFGAFRRVQTKTAFLRFVDEFGLAHPATRVVHSTADLVSAATDFGFPAWLKTPEGTASVGVWSVRSLPEARRAGDIPGVVRALDGPEGLVVQAQAVGAFEQAHVIFDRGRLVAVRTDRRLAEGTHGGPALKVGVDRPVVVDEVRTMGRELAWHGGFSADYFWDEAAQRAAWIDANPRLTEPMNSLVNGVNLPEIQVRLSLGETVPEVPAGTLGARSHGLIHVMLGAAADGGGRRGLLEAVANVVAHRGEFTGSVEGLTPPRVDPPSAFAGAVILGQLLARPGSARRLAESTIANYSLGPAIAQLAAASPVDLGVVC